MFRKRTFGFPGRVSRIFGMVGLDHVFPTYPIVDAADAASG